MNDNNAQRSGKQAQRTSGRQSNVPSMKRRALLKGAAGSLPMVLTLQSGAALARSSNLISPTSVENAVENNMTMCLETENLDALGDGMYDVGDPIRRQRLQMIQDRDYYFKPLRDGPPMDTSEEDMCLRGGTYKARGGGNTQYEVKPGMLVSATALSSFASHIDVDYI